MAARDRWIGWDEARAQPPARGQVKNLASVVLARGVKQRAHDWSSRYGVEPWLVETLVDGRRYRASCYRAANWLALGETSGRPCPSQGG